MNNLNRNTSYQAPKWLDRPQEWFCVDELWEEVLGNLQEPNYLQVQKVEEQKAQTLYLKEVFVSLLTLNRPCFNVYLAHSLTTTGSV